ncbi:MAG: hypothetical protein JWO93_965 [Micrococcaceae bacterium]|jgi:hypothetical protein|nr:hypothetical protein [Micrococcaceae bacterium]
MTGKGTLFGWAFGDIHRADEDGYLNTLRDQALQNARQDAHRRGVQVVEGSESFMELRHGHALPGVGEPPQGLMVRCTVELTGPGAENISGEGPMNG